MLALSLIAKSQNLLEFIRKYPQIPNLRSVFIEWQARVEIFGVCCLMELFIQKKKFFVEFVGQIMTSDFPLGQTGVSLFS